MNLIEAVRTGRPFKRPNWVSFAVRDAYNPSILRVGQVVLMMTVEDILADDYYIDIWYEDFEKRYPNGVLCKVWDDEKDEKKTARVIAYKRGWENYPFLTDSGIAYKHAEPVKPEEAPAIIGAEIIKKEGEKNGLVK